MYAQAFYERMSSETTPVEYARWVTKSSQNIVNMSSNSLEYIESIMEDVSDIVKSEAVQNANIGSSNDKTEALQSSNDEPVRFAGFDDLYEKMLALEDQLICKEFKNRVGRQCRVSSLVLFVAYCWAIWQCCIGESQRGYSGGDRTAFNVWRNMKVQLVFFASYECTWKRWVMGLSLQEIPYL